MKFLWFEARSYIVCFLLLFVCQLHSADQSSVYRSNSHFLLKCKYFCIDLLNVCCCCRFFPYVWTNTVESEELQALLSNNDALNFITPTVVESLLVKKTPKGLQDALGDKCLIEVYTHDWCGYSDALQLLNKGIQAKDPCKIFSDLLIKGYEPYYKENYITLLCALSRQIVKYHPCDVVVKAIFQKNSPIVNHTDVAAELANSDSLIFDNPYGLIVMMNKHHVASGSGWAFNLGEKLVDACVTSGIQHDLDELLEQCVLYGSWACFQRLMHYGALLQNAHKVLPQALFKNKLISLLFMYGYLEVACTYEQVFDEEQSCWQDKYNYFVCVEDKKFPILTDKCQHFSGVVPLVTILKKSEKDAFDKALCEYYDRKQHNKSWDSRSLTYLLSYTFRNNHRNKALYLLQKLLALEDPLFDTKEVTTFLVGTLNNHSRHLVFDAAHVLPQRLFMHWIQQINDRYKKNPVANRVSAGLRELCNYRQTLFAMARKKCYTDTVIMPYES